MNNILAIDRQFDSWMANLRYVLDKQRLKEVSENENEDDDSWFILMAFILFIFSAFYWCQTFVISTKKTIKVIPQFYI
jgi:hypothetical protein